MTKRVFVLGAGASHGNGTLFQPKPPLMCDFLSNDIKSYTDKIYNTLWKYLDDIGLKANEKNFEFIIQELEQVYDLTHPKFGWVNRKDLVKRYGKEFEFVTPAYYLRSFILDVISITTNWLSSDILCPYHEVLVNNWLNKGDVIISYNYDLIIDVALQRSKNISWYENTGYGFMKEVNYTENEFIKSDVTLLKPHGSINWIRSSGTMFENFQEVPVSVTVSIESIAKSLKDYARPKNKVKSLIGCIESVQVDDRINFCFAQNKIDSSFPCIVFPKFYKPGGIYQPDMLEETWKKIEDNFLNCEEIVSIGYSWVDSHVIGILRGLLKMRENKLTMKIVPNDVADKLRKNLPEKYVNIVGIGNRFEEIAQNNYI